MERPTGVTVLAVLNFIGAACGICAGLLFLLLGASVATFAPPGGFREILAGLGAVVGAVSLVMAGIAVLIGVGLLRLRNWARMVTMALAAVSLLFAAGGLLLSMLAFEPLSLTLQGAFAALYAWIAWYLFQPHVKRAFGVA